jgi:Flp pilus assembly protein TadD
LQPNSAILYNSRGFAYVNKSDRTNAVADYRKALSIDPSYFRARNNLDALGVKE